VSWEEILTSQRPSVLTIYGHCTKAAINGTSQHYKGHYRWDFSEPNKVTINGTCQNLCLDV
jgi:hypothetical protein